MSHVWTYRGQYFRIEIAAVAKADDPAGPTFVAWASEPFRELAQMPKSTATRFVPGPPQATAEGALAKAHEWIRTQADAREARETHAPQPPRPVSVLYTVWVFKRDEEPAGYDFENFWEAEAFAEAAKKTVAVAKVGIKNNESPQFLTVWERG
jgi:hypothetical protein